jgi:hypothetical protein
VLYEMLTGHLPFEDMGQLIDPTFIPPSPRQLRPSVPPRLDETVMLALSKEPSCRPRSAAEMRGALEKAAMPFDWGAAARRALAVAAVGFMLTACLVVGGFGAISIANLLRSMPDQTPPPTTVLDSAEFAKGSEPAPTFTPTAFPTPIPALMLATCLVREAV